MISIGIRQFRASSRAAGYSLILLIAVVSITAAFVLSCGHAGATGDGAPFAYAINNTNNTVSVIDMDTYEVVATIRDIDDPIGLAVSPDGRRLYVTDGDQNSTTVIDTSTNRPIAIIPVGYMPTGVAVSPDGKTAYVTNVWGKSVSVIDTTDNEVIDTLDAGQNPSDVSINPQTGDVYVSNHVEGTISVYRQDAPIKTIRVGNEAGESGVTPDGSRLYVTCPNDHYVSIIDTATDQVVDQYATDRYTTPEDIAFSPDGSLAYIMTLNGSSRGREGIDVVGTGDNKLLRNYPVYWPSAIAVSPDGQALVVSSGSADGTIVLQSSDGSRKASLSIRALNVVASNAGINASSSPRMSTPSPGPTKASGPALPTAPTIPSAMPTIPPSAAGPMIAPPTAGLPIIEVAVICAIIVLVIAILVLVAVAGYVLMKK